jgi:hypothetical protein
MTDQLKSEILEQLKCDIQFGFENEAQLFESLSDMFYEEEQLDEAWLRQLIREHYAAHQYESRSWTLPTDFDRLAAAFDELVQQHKIVCLHNAGITMSDGETDCMEVVAQLEHAGIVANGYCFYHSQDLMRAIDAECRNLFIAFDSPDQDNDKAIIVAKQIIDTLKRYHFEVAWPGTVDERIEIRHIDWKKVPDNKDWRAGRVLALLTNTKTKKPFWKFW